MQLVVVPDAPTIPTPPEWSERAVCRGKTTIFFGSPRERPGRRRRREALAKSYCAVCPLIEPCRELGRLNRENGIWGGENEEERAAAGFPPRATERRSVAAAARTGRLAEAG
jgi:WhiB family redox-sensing transcriptional regulator